MQHQQPYTFSALFWETDGWTNGFPNVKPYQKRRTFTILACAESTRSKRQVVKTRDCWDNPAATRLVMENPAEDLIPTLSDSASCYYFWDCLRYATILAFCEDLDDEFDWGDKRVDEFVIALPKPNWDRYAGPDKATFTFDYFKLLIDAFPDLKIEKVDIGF